MIASIHKWIDLTCKPCLLVLVRKNRQDVNKYPPKGFRLRKVILMFNFPISWMKHAASASIIQMDLTMAIGKRIRRNQHYVDNDTFSLQA